MINIEEMLKKIEKAANEHDDEIAHVLLDELYISALMHIAEGLPGFYCKSIAKEVLKGEDIEFSRWCA